MGEPEFVRVEALSMFEKISVVPSSRSGPREGVTGAV